MERRGIYLPLYGRGVFDRNVSRERRKKLVKSFDVKINNIIIDGLNVLISINSYLLGKLVFRSMDGYLRDISGVYGNFTYQEKTKKAFELLINVLTSIIKIEERNVAVYIYLDYRASRAGDFAGYMRSIFLERGIEVEVTVNRNCDHLVVEKSQNLVGTNVVATSDTVIIDNVSYVIDIPSLVIERLLRKNIIDLKKISGFRSLD